MQKRQIELHICLENWMHYSKTDIKRPRGDFPIMQLVHNWSNNHCSCCFLVIIIFMNMLNTFTSLSHYMWRWIFTRLEDKFSQFNWLIQPNSNWLWMWVCCCCICVTNESMKHLHLNQMFVDENNIHTWTYLLYQIMYIISWCTFEMF